MTLTLASLLPHPNGGHCVFCALWFGSASVRRAFGIVFERLLRRALHVICAEAVAVREINLREPRFPSLAKMECIDEQPKTSSLSAGVESSRAARTSRQRSGAPARPPEYL